MVQAPGNCRLYKTKVVSSSSLPLAVVVAAGPCSVAVVWAIQSAQGGTPCARSTLATAAASTRAVWAAAVVWAPPRSCDLARCWSRTVFGSWVSRRLLIVWNE